jgi:outer membrane receptor protein involved in Fe transport
LYATDTWGLTDSSFLTLSGRYNHATVKLEDRLGTALNGDHAFNRFNPAIGLTYNPTPGITTYAAYNEGMRVPTPVELSCADPNAPCSLPNAFSSDPALKPVISKAWELGARGHMADWGWSAALFRTQLHDDIQFISSGGGATSAGYFQNVGRTLRQGVELGLEGRQGAWRFSAHLSQMAATFQTPLVLNSPSNSTATAISCATCTDIQVRPGDHLPGLPQRVIKLRADWAATSALSMGLHLQAQSSQFARGDENNQDARGAVPGYAIVNLDARYRVARGWEAFAKVDNLFDRRYSTFGSLGQSVFTGPGASFDPSGASWRNEQFRTVGVPRGAWIGLSYRFGDGVDADT